MDLEDDAVLARREQAAVQVEDLLLTAAGTETRGNIDIAVEHLRQI